MTNVKPLASLSLDLDNEWSYLKAHADPTWTEYPSYLNLAIPRILSVLKECDLKITFFIVGTDASFEKNHDVLSSLVKEGHEIGNHSFKHEPWLHRYSESEFDDELKKAEDAITRMAVAIAPREGWRRDRPPRASAPARRGRSDRASDPGVTSRFSSSLESRIGRGLLATVASNLNSRSRDPSNLTSISSGPPARVTWRTPAGPITSTSVRSPSIREARVK